MDQKNLKLITAIPTEEKELFKKMIQSYRKKHIKSPQEAVNQAFNLHSDMLKNVKHGGNISEVIHTLREEAYSYFLKDEAKFNIEVLKDVSLTFNTPKNILSSIIDNNILEITSKEQLIPQIIKTCGEYAGSISPYIYELCLSNTQSRRSRAGKTFEQVIYKIYEAFNYPYQSQSKVGKATFKSKGLGKMVDSLLPNIDAFEKRRDKVIIGTMKTTLRERWQEVIEEIARTSLPSIYLLTIDDDISTNKAEQMGKHNVILVVPKNVKEKPTLKNMPNIISFESYFLDEIPEKLKFWAKT